MGPRPYRPPVELEGAIERGELDFAILLAREVAEDRHRPIDLDHALRMFPLVIAQRLDEYDAWALRWLGRWISETPSATVEQAAEIAGCLADLPTEPSAMEAIKVRPVR
jgi:hypothetical protein